MHTVLQLRGTSIWAHDARMCVLIDGLSYLVHYCAYVVTVVKESILSKCFVDLLHKTSDVSKILNSKINLQSLTACL